MLIIYIVICVIFIFVIQSCKGLKCYSCRKRKESGRTFSTDLVGNEIIDGNDLYDSCSITVNANGFISRDLMPVETCRSSSYQFCCNQNLCNSLPLPPLPAFTTLQCAYGSCQMKDNQCKNSVVYRSSATDSCVRTHRGSVHQSYQTGCSPNNTMTASLGNQSVSPDVFCCNGPLCNQQLLPSGIGIRCYTCDSRITGLKSCSLLKRSPSHIYISASSSRSESCAMIIGLTGKDLITGDNYPAFTIRTFIDHCINQSLGNITYGGASFQGRIDCCSTSLCNNYPLYTNITLQTDSLRLPKLIVFISVVCLGFIFVVIGISLSIYRFYLYKSPNRYLPGVKSDGTTVMFPPSH